MNAEDLAVIRHGAELQNMKPYMDSEITSLQNAVISSVLAAVNKGTLTPDMALSKWVEYISYIKLSQKFEQRIAVGQAVGAQNASQLDIQPQKR